MKRYIAKTILMVEMQISDPDAVKDQIAMALDSFREATQPANEWGLTFWLATREDLDEMAISGDLLPNPGVHIREEEILEYKSMSQVMAETLERAMQIAKDTQKEFTYSKDRGRWSWYNRGEENCLHGRFKTFYEALLLAVEPYWPENSGEYEGCPNCDGKGRDTCPLCSGTNKPFPEESTEKPLKEDLGTYLEIARRALTNSELFEDLASELDLSDDEMIRLRDQLQKHLEDRHGT